MSNQPEPTVAIPAGTSADDIRTAVADHYGMIAATGDTSLESCCVPAGCGSEAYLGEELVDIPSSAVGLSLGCGDPVTGAGLAPGQTVLDLGSGGGLDCLLAAKVVGPTGTVIGVDMTPAMLERARETASRIGAANVEYRQGTIESLPVADVSVDVVISNCVINLAPDKMPVLREVFRVLRPGGRMHVTDIVTAGVRPAEHEHSIESWSACIAGALPDALFGTMLHDAGFSDVTVTRRPDGDTDSREPRPGEPYSAVISATKPMTGPIG